MNILFVCQGNMSRSQMASAFFDSLTKNKNHVSTSAGTVVVEAVQGMEVKDRVKQVMAEEGIDMTGKVRKQLTKQMVDGADKIIVITEPGTHPDYLKESAKVEYWDIADTKEFDYTFKQKIRDQIKARVEKLVREIDKCVE